MNYTKSIFLHDIPVDVSLLSRSAITKDAVDGTVRDLAKSDSISIILGLIIVTLFIRQFNLLIISLLNLVITFSVSFGISYLISQYMDVASFCPSV